MMFAAFDSIYSYVSSQSIQSFTDSVITHFSHSSIIKTILNRVRSLKNAEIVTMNINS